MTDTAPQTLAEIAGKLSEAQRSTVMFNLESGRPRYNWSKRGSACRALERKGLLIETSDDIGNRMWKLSATGLALRSYLMSNSEGKE